MGQLKAIGKVRHSCIEVLLVQLGGRGGGGRDRERE